MTTSTPHPSVGELPAHWLEHLFGASLTNSSESFWKVLAECLLEALPHDVIVIWQTFGVTVHERRPDGVPAVEENGERGQALRSPSLYTALNLPFSDRVRDFDDNLLDHVGFAKHPALRSLRPLHACSLDFLQPVQQLGATLIAYGPAKSSNTRHGFLDQLRPLIKRVYLSLLERERHMATGVGLGEFLREVPVGLLMADWFKNVRLVNDEAYRHSVMWNEGSRSASVKAARERFAVAEEIQQGWESLQANWIECLRGQAEPRPPLVIVNKRDPLLRATVSLIHSQESHAGTPFFMTRFSSVHTRSADAVLFATPQQISVLAELSPAERSVAVLVGQGLSNRQIAAHLSREVSTIKDHLTKVYSKTRVVSRSALTHLLNRS